MSLVLTFLGVSVAVATLLWAASVVLQPYLYSDPADRLPLRSLVGGLAVGLFLTGWTYLNTRASHQDKYGTLMEFTPTATQDVTEFEAVRRLNAKTPDGQWKEQTVVFKRASGRGAATTFAEAADPTQTYKPNTSNYMTVAVLVPDASGEKARFDAELDGRGTAYRSGSDKLFREKGGRRYVEVETPAVVYAPSFWAGVAAVLLNLAHFGLWFVVLWPVMRYGSGAALGGAAALGLLTMLAVMPLLFDSNRPPVAAVAR